MSRSKSASIISSSIKTNSNFKPLKKKFSLFSFLNEKRSIKKKQKRDVEQSITIGETYLIVHLYVNELVKRGNVLTYLRVTMKFIRINSENIP
jgi:hypothetical protein